MRSATFSFVAALLFIGPLFAGMSGAEPSVLLGFGAILLLWLMVTRPKLWALTTAEGTPLRLAAYLATATLAKFALVALCFAIGRGLAVVLDTALTWPLWFPLLLSLAAVPLGRVIRSPRIDHEETEAFIAEAEAKIEAAFRDKSEPDA